MSSPVTTMVASTHAAALRPQAPVRIAPWAAATTAAAVLCLLDRPAWGAGVFGGLLLVALHGKAAEGPRVRLLRQGVAVVALTGLVTVSLPLFLAAGGDALLVLILASAPLLALVLESPAVRRMLALRRPRPADALLFEVGAFTALLVATAVALTGSWSGVVLDPGVAVVLAVLVPMFDEALFRGLLLGVVGTGQGTVAWVALLQAGMVGAAYGFSALLVTAAMAFALGQVRRATGRWQASLATHLGFSIGLLLPYFLLLAAP